MVGRTDDSRRARAARSGGAAACQRRCSACLAMGYVRARAAVGKSALAYSRPSSPGAWRQGSSPLVRQESSGKPAAIRRALRARVPSAEARPVSAPSPIAGSAYRPELQTLEAGVMARRSKLGREASNATWRLWSRPASATGGGAHDFGCERSNDGSPTYPRL